MSRHHPWTPTQLVKWISQEFERHQLPEPHRFEAELLVAYALKTTRLNLYLNYDQPTTKSERTLLRSLTKRRLQREPLSYILGTSHFWNLELFIGKGVLTPRSETELLVETAIELIPPQTLPETPYRILELGTGTGAIPLGISSSRSNLRIIAVDICKEALHFAKINIDKYQSEIKKNQNKIIPIQGNCFESINNSHTFDMIISNPPYIPNDQYSTLQKEVHDWEPKKALLGGEKGLDFFATLKNEAEKRLRPGGHLIFEHGFDQIDLISNLFSTAKLLHLEATIRDYNGHDRIMSFQKQS